MHFPASPSTTVLHAKAFLAKCICTHHTITWRVILLRAIFLLLLRRQNHSLFDSDQLSLLKADPILLRTKTRCMSTTESSVNAELFEPKADCSRRSTCKTHGRPRADDRKLSFRRKFTRFLFLGDGKRILF